MSILIKGMDMPLSCETCEYKLCVWFMYQKDQVDEIIREHQARSYGLSRKDDCPYIEVPDVHGTNADRIRAMSDEELAIWISALFTTQYNIKADPNFWADWLKEEANNEREGT